MNILFCNIAWMKYYEGVTDEDKPINGGSYVKKNENGGECFNFQDYNGKCYGYVMNYGNLALEKHYKKAKEHHACIKDVLVVWVATNNNNETRIVGWYKNATLYREEQFIQSFIDEGYNLNFRMETSSKNCFLLPEEKRTFPIERAAQSGKGTGLGRSNVWYAESAFAKTVIIPKVLDYIENYKGEYANQVITEDLLGEIYKDTDWANDYEKLTTEGMKYFNNNEFFKALKCFNSARLIKETPDVLICIADVLVYLNCFDKAIPLYNELIQIEGEKVDTIARLISVYDRIGKREKTIEYCNKQISLLDDSKEGIDEKIRTCILISHIYFCQNNHKKARDAINRISNYSDDQNSQQIIKEILATIDKEVSNW